MTEKAMLSTSGIRKKETVVPLAGIDCPLLKYSSLTLPSGYFTKALPDKLLCVQEPWYSFLLFASKSVPMSSL
jgi:hypothetical protein